MHFSKGHHEHHCGMHGKVDKGTIHVIEYDSFVCTRRVFFKLSCISYDLSKLVADHLTRFLMVNFGLEGLFS